VFGHDLANPGWSLLLELFRADLEERPVNLARLATDARVAATTAFRWIVDLSASGFVNRMPDPKRPKGIRLALTNAGRDAMEDYFVAVLIGWKEG
jgi:DNA-binding MarR family transcriptional regulator